MLHDAPALFPCQVCTGRTTNLNYGSQRPEVQRCGKKPTRQLCFPSRSLGEPWPFLPAPCPAITQPRTHSQRTAFFPLSKAGQAQYVGSHYSAQLTDPRASRLEGPCSCPRRRLCCSFAGNSGLYTLLQAGLDEVNQVLPSPSCSKGVVSLKRMAKGTVIFQSSSAGSARDINIGLYLAFLSPENIFSNQGLWVCSNFGLDASCHFCTDVLEVSLGEAWLKFWMGQINQILWEKDRSRAKDREKRHSVSFGLLAQRRCNIMYFTVFL